MLYCFFFFFFLGTFPFLNLLEPPVVIVPYLTAVRSVHYIQTLSRTSFDVRGHRIEISWKFRKLPYLEAGTVINNANPSSLAGLGQLTQ